jgi:hypothetical protein
MSEDATKKFLEKHKPLKPEDIKKSLADAESSRTNYSKNIDEIEANLVGFLQKEDPIVDPGTGKVIGWIRQVPVKELQSLSREFANSLEGMTEEQAQKALDENPDLAIKQYELMARVISKPKHDAKWWSDNTTIDFMKIFELAWQESLERTVSSARFLPEQTTG